MHVYDTMCIYIYTDMYVDQHNDIVHIYTPVCTLHFERPYPPNNPGNASASAALPLARASSRPNAVASPEPVARARAAGFRALGLRHERSSSKSTALLVAQEVTVCICWSK